MVRKKVTLSVNKLIKDEAQEILKAKGLTLSFVFEQRLREIIDEENRMKGGLILDGTF